MDLHAVLADFRRYRHQIERLHKKCLFTPKLYTLQYDGVSLASLAMNASRAAKVIAKTIDSEQYQARPVQMRRICVEGKERIIYTSNLVDMIVYNVVTEIIRESISPFLSPQLYSYRKGISWVAPALDFAAYIRAHRRGHVNLSQRGIYVLRRDIQSYTDSIPVGRKSQVWSMIQEPLRAAGFFSPISDYDWHLIESVVRPEVSDRDGSVFCPVRGIPTGQPITSVLYNLYLSPLDRQLSSIPGAFYARYSDDLLFAHPDAKVTQTAARQIDQILSELSLCANPTKSLDLYLTSVGRGSFEWQEAKGTACVRFVGMRISGDGTVGLESKKMRALLRDVEGRAIRTANALRGRDQDDIGRVVCSVINRVLDPDTPFYQQQSASLVRRVVTDRKQLAQLDYWIARIVLRAVTGRDDVRAFRQIPYRKLRQDWQLVSLLHSRNKWGRK